MLWSVMAVGVPDVRRQAMGGGQPGGGAPAAWEGSISTPSTSSN